MANMLDISEENGPPWWVNLDVVFTVSQHFQPVEGGEEGEGSMHVVLFTQPGGMGQVLPPHISIEEVVAKMQGPKTVYTI